jgi:hypothetical protein
MMMKVGDKVKIKKRTKSSESEFPHYTSYMEKYTGKTATIVYENDGLIRLDVDNEYFCWHPKWLIPIRKEDKKIEEVKEPEEKFIDESPIKVKIIRREENE